MQNNIINVLLIDDDNVYYVLLKSKLLMNKANKYTIKWIDNYTEAMEEIKINNYDVCLVDYYLEEGYNGLEIIQTAIQNDCKIPMILLTSADNHNLDYKALSCGASDYLSKDSITDESLSHSINYAIRNKKMQLELEDKNKELEDYHKHLEKMVNERTLELEITNRKYINSEKQLRTLINAIPNIIYLKDENNRILEANDYFVKIFNLEKVQYKGKKFYELIEFSQFYEGVFINFDTNDNEVFETTYNESIIPMIDSSLKTFYLIRVPLFSSDNQKTGIATIGIDITDRKEMELELIKNNNIK